MLLHCMSQLDGAQASGSAFPVSESSSLKVSEKPCEKTNGRSKEGKLSTKQSKSKNIIILRLPMPSTAAEKPHPSHPKNQQVRPQRQHEVPKGRKGEITKKIISQKSQKEGKAIPKRPISQPGHGNKHKLAAQQKSNLAKKSSLSGNISIAKASTSASNFPAANVHASTSVRQTFHQEIHEFQNKLDIMVQELSTESKIIHVGKPGGHASQQNVPLLVPAMAPPGKGTSLPLDPTRAGKEKHLVDKNALAKVQGIITTVNKTTAEHNEQTDISNHLNQPYNVAMSKAGVSNCSVKAATKVSTFQLGHANKCKGAAQQKRNLSQKSALSCNITTAKAHSSSGRATESTTANASSSYAQASSKNTPPSAQQMSPLGKEGNSGRRLNAQYSGIVQSYMYRQSVAASTTNPQGVRRGECVNKTQIYYENGNKEYNIALWEKVRTASIEAGVAKCCVAGNCRIYVSSKTQLNKRHYISTEEEIPGIIKKVTT